MNRASRGAFALVILIYLGITIGLAYKLNIWVDEGFSLRTTEKGVAHAVHQAFYFELQPPLYYILLSLWRGLNSSIFFARLFSVFCVGLSVVLSRRLADHVVGDSHGGWFAAIVAFNPFSIWAATEIRSYGLIILLTVLLLYLFWKGYIDVVSSPIARYLYLVASSASLYTNYYLGFLLAANAACLLFARRWTALRSYMMGMGMVGFFFSPMMMIVLDQVSSHPALVETPHSVFKSLIVVIFRSLTYMMPINLATSSFYEPEFLYYIPFCLVLGYFAVKRLRPIADSYAPHLGVILVTLWLFFAGIHQISDRYLFFPKHTAALYIPSVFTGFLLLVKLGHKRIFYGVVCLVFLIYGRSLYGTYKSPNKVGDYARACAYIMENEKDDQPILTFRSEIAVPFGYYYKGRNVIVPIPAGHTSPEYERQVLRSEEEIFAGLTRIPCKFEEFWIVSDTFTRDDQYLGVVFNKDLLEQFVERHCVVIIRREFRGSYVRLVQYNGNSTGKRKSERE